MTPEERRLFIEFLQSIQSMESLNIYLNSKNNTTDVFKLAEILKPGAYLETIPDEKMIACYDNLKEVPLKCNGGDADKLIDYLKDRWDIELRPGIVEFVKNNYEKITPQLIFQEEKFLQNKHIEDLQLKTGLSKKQAKQFETYFNNGSEIEAETAIYNEIASALCQHPEIKKLELEKAEKLDDHAKQVVEKVVEDIKSGNDKSGMFFPYVDSHYFNVGPVDLMVDAWNIGRVKPVDVKRVTREDIKKELMEGLYLRAKDGGKAFVKKSEEELKAEDIKREELEEANRQAEEKAKNLAVNGKNLSAEVPFNAEEDDITFYKECFDQKKVPGLYDMLFSKKISELDIKQFDEFETEVYHMIHTSAAAGNMSYEAYELTDVRHLIRYAAAKQDGMLMEGEEYKVDDEKINKSKTENKKYIDELDKIVKQSELFMSHLTDSVPTYEPTDGSYLKTFEKNEKQYVNKLNNAFDYLSAQKQDELIREAERLSKDHPYIRSTDIMRYVIHQESEILRSYHACVDPDDNYKTIDNRNTTPFTLEAIGRGVGIKAKEFELKKQEELKKQAEAQIAEEQKQEVKEEPEIIEQPQNIEEEEQEIGAALAGNGRQYNYINTDLQENIKQIASGLEKINNKAVGYSQAFALVMNMHDLQDAEKKYFDEEGNIKPESYEMYHQLCVKTKETFYNLSELASNDQCPKEIKDIISYAEGFRGSLTADLNPFIKEAAFKTDWQLNEAQTQERDRILNEWLQYVDLNDVPQVSYYAEDAFQQRFPNDILLTGDVNDLASFYVKHSAEMTAAEKDYLKGLGQTVIFYNKLESDSRQYQPSSRFSVEVNKEANSVMLTGFDNDYQYQNTANGCWSCAYSMLLKSRGIDLDQRLIRSFRTDRNYYQNTKNPKHAAGAGLTGDRAYNPTDVADLTAKLLPNTAMHTAVFAGLNTMDPQTRSDNAAVMKQMVYKQLVDKKNPVAMSFDGHYMTIVGMEGDNFKVLDSIDRTNDSHLITMPMSRVLASNAANLIWLEELTRTPENKVAVGAPFEHVKYSENTLVSSGSQEGINTAGESFDGLGFYAVDPNREPVMVQESLYAPYDLTDPAMLKEKDPDIMSLIDKKFMVETPYQSALNEDIKMFNSASAPDANDKFADKDAVLKRSVALMITHKCMDDDFKYVLEDKHVIQRTLRRDTDVAIAVSRLEGFDEFVSGLNLEGGPLYQKSDLDPAAVDEIYKNFTAKFPKPVNEINKAMNKDVDPKKVFNSKAFANELKEIGEQIKKASKTYKNAPQADFKLLTDTLNGLSGTFSAMPNGVESGRKSYNRLFSDYGIAVSKLKFSKGWSVGKKMPTASEIQQLKLLQRIDNAHRFVAERLSPEEIAKQKLCEKLLAAKASNLVKSKNPAEAKRGLDILINNQTHNTEFNAILNDAKFRSIVAGKDLKALNKLVKADNDKMLKTYNETVVKAGRAAGKPVNESVKQTSQKNM